MKSIQKIARSLLCLLCLLCAVLLIQNAPVVAKGAVQGIRLCLQTVMPSLFCFMVLTCFLINSGLYRFLSLPLAWVTRRLFFLPPELGSILLLGCLEVTNGCSLASTLPLGAVFASCFLSFGGLSVLAQIMGILKGTHIRILPILLSRLLHALVSGVLTFILLKSLGESVSVFAAQTHPIPVADPATPFLCLCLIMMGVLLLQQLSCPMQKKHSSLL